MSTTSHYKVFGTLPTLTEEEKQDILTAKELPGVSATDNGKVLTVVDGKWAKAAPVTYTLPEATSETLGGVHQAANVEESSATSVAGLKDTVNAILSGLKAAGIMAPDPEVEEQAET